MKRPPICGLKEHREYQTAKRRMYDGNLNALNTYSELYHRRLLFGNNPELAEFAEGKPITPSSLKSRNINLHHLVRGIYKNYISSLLHETHDIKLFSQMEKDNIKALKVFEIKEVYREMAGCGIDKSLPQAVWLLSTHPHRGYLLTHELENKENREHLSQDEIDNILKTGRSTFFDFFEYEPKSGLFLKHPNNTWGGREIGQNIQFRGLISYEHPISIRKWFETVVRNLYQEMKK